MRWVYSGVDVSFITTKRLSDTDLDRLSDGHSHIFTILFFGDEHDDLDIDVFRFDGWELIRIDDVVYVLSGIFPDEEIVVNFPNNFLLPAQIYPRTVHGTSDARSYDPDAEWFRELLAAVNNPPFEHRRSPLGDDASEEIFHVDIDGDGMSVYSRWPKETSIMRGLLEERLTDSLYVKRDVRLPSELTSLPVQVGLSFCEVGKYFPILLSDGTVLVSRTCPKTCTNPFQDFSVFALGPEVEDEINVQALGVEPTWSRRTGYTGDDKMRLVVITNSIIHLYAISRDGIRRQYSVDGVIAHSYAKKLKRARRRIKSAV